MGSNNQFLTNKQYQILTVLCDGDGKDEDGNFIATDLDELLDRVAYHTNKDSMQFSIRVLMKHGYITKDYAKRRGARRVIYTPTKLARQVMGRMEPQFFEQSDLDDIDLPDTDTDFFAID